jgi:hypothetical protein
MGVKTLSFGPFAWTVLEGIANYYDYFMKNCRNSEKDKDAIQYSMRALLFSIGFIIPCVYCRISFREFTDPESPHNSGCDIYKMLSLKDGAKRLVYNLHNAVSHKLRTQEVNKASDNVEMTLVNKKWEDKHITFDEALNFRFPKITSKQFWNATIIFLGYIMCDIREDEWSFIETFIRNLSFMLDLSKDTETIPFAKAYRSALEKLNPMFEHRESLSERIDIVWVIKKHIFLVKGWEMNGHTQSSFQDKCSTSVVKSCEKKDNFSKTI